MFAKFTVTKDDWLKLLVAAIMATAAIFFFHNWAEIFVPIVVGFAMLASAFEYGLAVEKKGGKGRFSQSSVLVLCLSIPFSALFSGGDRPGTVGMSATVGLLIIVILCMQSWKKGEDEPLERRWERMKDMLLGAVWIFGGGLAAMAVSQREQGNAWIFLLMSVTWGCDVVANMVGRLVGGKIIKKRRPFAKLSPKKSWEGTIAGVLATIPISYIPISYYEMDIGYEWCILAVKMGAVAVAGDLLGSLVKRVCGIESFGKIIPKHGGVLDRFDAFFFVAPFFYLMTMSQYGV